MTEVQPKYAEESKAHAMRLSYDGGRPAPVPEAARDLGIPSGTPRQSVQQVPVDDLRSATPRREYEAAPVRRAQPVASEEISLTDVWNALKRGRIKLLAWLLIVMLVAGACGAGYVFLSSKELVTALVQFSHEGAESGLDPRGAMLDVATIKGPHIVQPVLSQLGYQDGDNEVNAETVRQAITIEGQLPKDVVDRLTVTTTIATTPASVENLEKVLDIDYYPTQYRITLDAGALGIPAAEGRELLNGILAGYDQYFYQTYADAQMMGTALKGFDYASYDYTETLDVLEAQIDVMTEYVNKMRAQGGGFWSVSTGYTFADISATLNVVRSMDLAPVAALVSTNNLSKDRAALGNRLDQKLEEKNQQLLVAQRVLAAINDRINSCQNDTIVVQNSDDQWQDAQTDVTWTRPSNEYDKLIKQGLEVSEQIALVQVQIDKLQRQIESAQDLSTGTVSADYENLCKEVEAKLEGLVQKLQDWATVIDQTSEEYLLTGKMKDAFKIKVSAQSTSQGRLTKMVIYAIIGAVGGMGLALLLYVMGVCFHLATSDKRRRHDHYTPGVSA